MLSIVLFYTIQKRQLIFEELVRKSEEINCFIVVLDFISNKLIKRSKKSYEKLFRLSIIKDFQNSD